MKSLIQIDQILFLKRWSNEKLLTIDDVSFGKLINITEYVNIMGICIEHKKFINELQLFYLPST